MFEIGGLTVSRLWGKIDTIARYAPTTVILDIGTNDVRVSTSPECLARDIVEVARAIRRLPSVRVVMVMPIITRMVGCRRTPTDVEQKRHRVNDIVRALLQSGQTGELFPWKHRGCAETAPLRLKRPDFDFRLQNEGFREGFAIGQLNGYGEGYALGQQHGTELSLEIGFYKGFVAVWQNLTKGTSPVDNRKSKAIQKLAALLEMLKFESVSEEQLQAIRDQFKLVKAVLNISAPRQEQQTI